LPAPLGNVSGVVGGLDDLGRSVFGCRDEGDEEFRSFRSEAPVEVVGGEVRGGIDGWVDGGDSPRGLGDEGVDDMVPRLATEEGESSRVFGVSGDLRREGNKVRDGRTRATKAREGLTFMKSRRSVM